MRKIDNQKASSIIGGVMGCDVSNNRGLDANGKIVCYRTVGCIDKWGEVTSDNIQVDMSECK